MKIAQLVPALHHGDAIGNNATALKKHFAVSGHVSEVFYMDADASVARQGLHWSEYRDWIHGNDLPVTILHYALPSMLNDLFREAPGRRILVYHNITPPEFLSGYPHLQFLSREGRRELAGLKDIPDMALGDSEYNRRELESLGFKCTREMPIFMDFKAYDAPACPITQAMFRARDMVTFLFVGRITPNKCQHDIIRLYGLYKRTVNPRCRLILVGKYDGFTDYLWRCQKAVNRLGIGDVHFTGRVTHRELLAYYRMADIFVSMSEHEGFGVPLIEAMYMGIPVMAYAAAAVPFTLGPAGVMFRDKTQWIELAELAEVLIRNDTVRDRVLAGQRRRLEVFTQKTVSRQWDTVMHDITA